MTNSTQSIAQYSGNLNCPNFFNFDLSNSSALSTDFAPFNSPTNVRNTEPWFSSHGSPQTLGTDAIFLASVSVNNDGACPFIDGPTGGYTQPCANWGSEGVFYDNYIFEEGHVYEISFRAFGRELDDTYILLADNYFTHNTNNWQGGDIGDPNYEDPSYYEVINDVRSNIDDFFIVWNAKDFTESATITQTITFVPDKDYNQLFISLYDPELFEFNGLSYTRNLQIFDLVIIGSCLPEKEIPNPNDLPTSGLLDNYQIVDINNSQQSIQLTNIADIDIEAGKLIKITPTTTNSFKTNLGANLTLEIEECYTCEGFNTCQYYIDDDLAQIFIPNIFNTCSAGSNSTFLISHGYTGAEYNAYYAELLIFDRFGSLILEEEYQAAQYEPLTNTIIEWDGSFNGQATNEDVYSYKLTLINCFNNGEPTQQEFLGDVTKIGNCE